jgi:hypothetical protein
LLQMMQIICLHRDFNRIHLYLLHLRKMLLGFLVLTM